MSTVTGPGITNNLITFNHKPKKLKFILPGLRSFRLRVVSPTVRLLYIKNASTVIHSYCYIAKFADYVEAHELIYKVHDNYTSQHN